MGLTKSGIDNYNYNILKDQLSSRDYEFCDTSMNNLDFLL